MGGPNGASASAWLEGSPTAIKMPKIKFKIDLKNNQIIFSLNPKIYPPEVIYSTAYVFVDRAYIFLDGDPKKGIKVFLKGKKSLTAKQLKNLKDEFLNALLNSSLREKIAKKKKKILEYIVGGAITAALEKPKFEEPAKGKEMEEVEKEIAALKKELEKKTGEDYQKELLEIAKPYERQKRK